MRKEWMITFKFNGYYLHPSKNIAQKKISNIQFSKTLVDNNIQTITNANIWMHFNKVPLIKMLLVAELIMTKFKSDWYKYLVVLWLKFLLWNVEPECV